MLMVLLFFLILCPEKDVNGDTLWVWCYPSVDSQLREVLLSKCCLTQHGRDFHPFVFGQFCRAWFYISTVEVQEPTALQKVQQHLPLTPPVFLMLVICLHPGKMLGQLDILIQGESADC